MSNLLLWVGALAAAQTPSDPWRTVRTEHFRIHYPLAAATWSEGAAARLEEWHARVVAEVGCQRGEARLGMPRRHESGVRDGGDLRSMLAGVGIAEQ